MAASPDSLDVLDEPDASEVLGSSLVSSIARTTTSPLVVNLTALEVRLEMTWPNRTGSPLTAAGTSGWHVTASSRSLARARSAIIVVLCSTMARGSKSTASRSSRPASILDRSRMSLTSDSRLRPAPSMPSASLFW